jgi:hypothetical protein
LDRHGEKRGNPTRLEPRGPSPVQVGGWVRAGTKAKKGFVIGRASFDKITAVEGIRLTSPMKMRAAEAEGEGLSPEKYRRAIVRSHRKA